MHVRHRRSMSRNDKQSTKEWAVLRSQRIKTARQTLCNAAGHRAWRSAGRIRQDYSLGEFAHVLPVSSRGETWAKRGYTSVLVNGPAIFRCDP